MKFRSLLLTAFVPVVFSNCSTTKSKPSSVRHDDGRVPSAARPEDVAAVDAWKQKGNSGGWLPTKETLRGPLTPANSGFVVDLDAQRAYLYQGSTLVAYSPIASGRKYYRTETGDYTIGQKDLNHRSSTYGSFVNGSGGTIMSDVQEGFDPTPPGARFEGALMKYFLRLYHNGTPTAMGLHRGILPGYPASHGCVRLPGNMAEWFFSNIQLGTPVAVRGVKNGVPIGQSQNRPSRAPKIYPTLKKKADPAVPPAPESDIKTPAPAPAPAPQPAPAPSPNGDPSAAPPPGQ